MGTEVFKVQTTRYWKNNRHVYIYGNNLQSIFGVLSKSYPVSTPFAVFSYRFPGVMEITDSDSSFDNFLLEAESVLLGDRACSSITANSSPLLLLEMPFG